MKNIIESNYKSIVDRGLISPKTTKRDFILKLEEEVQEFIDASLNSNESESEELADVILVCLNIAKHYGINIEREIKNKIRKNFNRAIGNI